MAKPKRNDFNKYLAELDEAALRAELSKLFDKLPQVQEFYAQELMSESERKAMLEAYKKKVYSQFWTRGENPRNASNAELKRLLTDFEQVSVFPHELIDLLLYRVEVATDVAQQFGGLSEGDYNAAHTAFVKAVKLMHAHQLMEHFQERCEALFQQDSVGHGYIESLEEAYYN